MIKKKAQAVLKFDKFFMYFKIFFLTFNVNLMQNITTFELQATYVLDVFFLGIRK